jgi:hypothetical protein
MSGLWQEPAGIPLSCPTCQCKVVQNIKLCQQTFILEIFSLHIPSTGLMPCIAVQLGPWSLFCIPLRGWGPQTSLLGEAIAIPMKSTIHASGWLSSYKKLNMLTWSSQSWLAKLSVLHGKLVPIPFTSQTGFPLPKVFRRLVSVALPQGQTGS